MNPAASAAADGNNFSNRSNRFWVALHLAGFTDVRLEPENERHLLEFGCGFTAVVSRPTKRADEVIGNDFKRARRGFEIEMKYCAPRSIAFLGKRAWAAMIDRPDVDWGGN